MNTYTGYTLVTATQAFFKRYADFNGRSTLSAYWYWTLASVIIAIIVNLLDVAMGAEAGQGMISSLWTLATLIPSLALLARRLHDTGKSAWNIAWFLLPLIGAIVILVFVLKDSQKGSNQWGPSEKYPEEA